jgi:hypothetical protein
MCCLRCRLDQRFTGVMTAQSDRDFRVDERQSVVRPFVDEKRRVAVHGELESIPRTVVGDVARAAGQFTDTDARFDGIRWRIARRKRFFERFVELQVGVRI